MHERRERQGEKERKREREAVGKVRSKKCCVELCE